MTVYMCVYMGSELWKRGERGQICAKDVVRVYMARRGEECSDRWLAGLVRGIGYWVFGIRYSVYSQRKVWDRCSPLHSCLFSLCWLAGWLAGCTSARGAGRGGIVWSGVSIIPALWQPHPPPTVPSSTTTTINKTPPPLPPPPPHPKPPTTTTTTTKQRKHSTHTPPTHLRKRPHARPHRIIRTLPPPPLPHHDALIRTPTHQVGQQGDDEDDAKHAPGAQRPGLGGRGRAAAEVAAARLEDVDAVVGCAEEGEGRVRGEGRVAVAEEGEEGGFLAGVDFAGRRGRRR